MSTCLPRERRRRRKTSQEERICPICSRAFKKAEHLARHLRSERPFTCEGCGKFFTRQDTLLRHSRSCRPETHLREQPDHGMNMIPNHISYQHGPPQPVSEIPPMTRTEQAIPMPEGPTPPELRCPPLTNELGSAIMSPGDLAINSGRHASETDDSLVTTLLSDGMAGVFRTQTTTWPTLWNNQWDTDWTSWLEGADFDPGDVNQTLLAITEALPKDGAEEIGGPPNTHVAVDGSPGSDSIQRRWHTFSEAITPSRETTPEDTTSTTGAVDQIHTHADDAYRQKLAESLRQRVQQPGILPSATFLDFCIQAYFTHFHAIFPLIHAPTFQPSRQNAALLLSICSIGSLCLGSSRAVAHGISIFERLHKAMLASWDTYISASGRLRIFGLQAALVGQTFGILLGRPKDLTGSETFHGCLIAWARKANIFKLQDESIAEVRNLEDNSPALIAAWKSWTRLEEKRRILLGIYIHDAELAKLHHHEPILRHVPERLPQVSSPELFAAANANAWKRMLMSTKAPTGMSSPVAEVDIPLPLDRIAGNDFLSYGILESIRTMIHEYRASAAWPTTVRKCESLLMAWYQRFRDSNTNGRIPDPFCHMILWHSIFMNLYAQFDDLECACGREGQINSQKFGASATAWARSVDAKRCLLHAVLLQQHFQSLAIGVEPAIHVPMALYYCGIAWTSFTRFNSGANDLQVGSVEAFDFPELRLLGIDQAKLFHDATRGIQWGRPVSGPFFMAISLLGKISHWKVSERFASTLLALQDLL
ncbi:hypothetical protein RU639_001134 [Aspergillus parasiticus]